MPDRHLTLIVIMITEILLTLATLLFSMSEIAGRKGD